MAEIASEKKLDGRGITIISDDNRKLLQVKLFNQEKTETIKFQPQEESNMARFTLNFDFDIDYSCLTLCGIKALAGPIFDCYTKNKGDWDRFIDCLKGKKVDILNDGIECIAECS